MTTDDLVTCEYLAQSEAFSRFSRIMHRLIGLPVILTNLTGDKVGGHTLPEDLNPLCLLIQSTPKGWAACAACDRAHAQQLAGARRPKSYRCHAGLVDMMAPVYASDRLIAIITCGQLLPEPSSEEGLAHLRETLKPLELPEDALRSAYGQARYLDANTVSTALDLLAFFAEHLCAEESQLRALAGTGGTTPVATALRYLHDYHTEDISLTGVARQVGWTPSYFSARFRAITGFTFVDYLHRLRVHHAQTLLQDTSRTVTDIAYACGFNSQSQFNRVFRAVTGTSPRAYRK